MPAPEDIRNDSPPGAQRLDKWLWFARVIKSRTQAQGLIEDGRVRVNRERVAKTSHVLKPGDVVTVSVARRVRVLKVLAPGVRRGPPAEAANLYEDLTPRPTVAITAAGASATTIDDATEPSPASAPLRRDPGSGRPTKRDRRKIDKLLGGE